ncbi:MAG: addiction module protein [Planctomycetaceae bacterium]|nr:addiction module protein [Planctomycetaceae bacterium]
MSSTTQQLLNDALELPTVERGRLATLLIESLDAEGDGDVAEAWDAEILRRLQSIDAGEVRMIPAQEAQAMIRGQHGPASA